jgi:hypothetical protein
MGDKLERGENVIEAAERALGPEFGKQLEWRRRMLLWMIPRISGDEKDKEQFVMMWEAALWEAHNEGIEPAADLVRQVHAGRPSYGLKVIGDALGKLAAKNRATGA